MAPAMPCQRTDKHHPSIVKANAEPKIGNGKEFKTVYGCIVEFHESTRQGAESLQSEDRTAGKGFTSMNHYNLVHKFIPMPQAMNPGCKGCCGQGLEKTRDNSSTGLGKSQEQKEVIREAQRDKKTSPLCFIDGHMSPQERGGVRTKSTEVQRQSRAPG